ncbi:succinoglycan biosynthesis transport protein exoT [Vibrio astriarenae]|nr:succinoglycan biosynthesis transport protein exoT [Vibrio sp. C7]
MVSVPSAQIYIEVMSLFLPVVMLQSVFQAKLIEQQAFAYIAKCQASVSTIATLIAIALAFNGQGAWSLMVQHIFTALALCLLFFRKVSVDQEERFATKTLKKILPYYYKSTIYNTILWLGSESPLLIASKHIGSAGAGIYSAMGRAARMPNEILGRAFQLSFFSELSAKKADRQQKALQQQQLFWSIKCRFLLLTTLYTLGALIAYPVVLIVLGEQYAAHADVFLAVRGFRLYLFKWRDERLLQGTGRINLITILSIVRCLFVMGACYTLFSINPSLEAIGQGFAMANSALFLVYLLTIFAVLKFSFKAYLKQIIPLITVLISAICCVLLIDTLADSENPIVQIATSISAYGIGFLISASVLLPIEANAIRQLIMKKLSTRIENAPLRNKDD